MQFYYEIPKVLQQKKNLAKLKQKAQDYFTSRVLQLQ